MRPDAIFEPETMHASHPDQQPVIRDLADFDKRSGNLAERLLFNHRLVIVVFCLFATLALGWKALGIQLNASFEKMIPTTHPYIANFLANRTDLPALGNSMHGWTVPGFGIKKTVIPGRLNEGWINVKDEGFYFGQCSQICGDLHSFMPIAVRVVSKDVFDKWVEQKKKAAGLLPATDVAAVTAPANR